VRRSSAAVMHGPSLSVEYWISSISATNGWLAARTWTTASPAVRAQQRDAGAVRAGDGANGEGGHVREHVREPEAAGDEGGELPQALLQVGGVRLAHVGDLELTHDEAQVLDGAGTTCAAVADEPGGLVVPFGIEVVDGVLQHTGRSVVVLRCHEHEAVVGRDGGRPLLRVVVGVHAHRGRGRSSSRGGRGWSRRSTSSNSASVRVLACCRTQLATASPLRPGRVLPRMIAILVMSCSFDWCARGGLRPATCDWIDRARRWPRGGSRLKCVLRLANRVLHG
jgi:hypothetical protein